MAAGAAAEAVVGPAGLLGPFLHTLEPKQTEYILQSPDGPGTLGETGADPRPGGFFGRLMHYFYSFPDASPLSFPSSEFGRQSVFPVVIQTRCLGGGVVSLYGVDRPQIVLVPPPIFLPQVFILDH